MKHTHTLTFYFDLLVQRTFFFFFLLCMQPFHNAEHKHWIPLLPPALLSSCFLSPLLKGFLSFPPLAPVTTSLHRLSTLNQCMVMVRDLDTNNQASAVRETKGQMHGRVGWWRDRGIWSWSGRRAVNGFGSDQSSDAYGTFWPHAISLFGSVSAAQQCQCSLSCPLLPLSSLFGHCKSVSLCLCVSHSSNMRPQKGSLGEVREVNQGDLLLAVAQRTGWRVAPGFSEGSEFTLLQGWHNHRTADWHLKFSVNIFDYYFEHISPWIVGHKALIYCL